jgi:O-Antigen ligase.
MAAGRTKRGFRDLPKEAFYLLGIVFFLFLAGALSTIWRGGAILRTLDFCKALVAWVLTYLVVTNFDRLRRIIFIQSASVALIAVVSVIKGHSRPRLEGVIGGIYSNPNDLAFAIVLSLPFCFAFMLRNRNLLGKMAWGFSMLVMCLALFMTASRAGFIDLIVTGVICLWIFGIKGKRFHLVAGAVLVALVVGVGAGGRLKDRFVAISGTNLDDRGDVSAYESYEQRRFLMVKSGEAILHYPWGLGLGNFAVYSGTWREVHTSYLQIASEGGLGALLLYLMFFGRGFSNLKRMRKLPGYDPEMQLFAGALFATLVGFLVGSLFAPEAYQYFPYFAVAYTSVMLAISREKQPLGERSGSLTRSRWSRVPEPAVTEPAANGSNKQPRSVSAALRDLN